MDEFLFQTLSFILVYTKKLMFMSGILFTDNTNRLQTIELFRYITCITTVLKLPLTSNVNLLYYCVVPSVTRYIYFALFTLYNANQVV